MNSGLIVSTNIASCAISKFLFPYVSSNMPFANCNDTSPLHSLYGFPACLAVSSKFANVIVYLIPVSKFSSAILDINPLTGSSSTYTVMSSAVIVPFIPLT